MCIWRNSSYESEDFAPSILHKLAIIELPVHTLAAYIVLFKTPSRMSSVKGMMLLMHFWLVDFELVRPNWPNYNFSGAYLDLFISALSTQYFLLPAAAGHSQGLYTYFGIPVKWQAYLYISGLCLAGTSVLSFFENRFTAVVRGKRSSLLHEKRRLWYIVGNYIFSFVCILPITFTPPEQSIGKAYVREVTIFLLGNRAKTGRCVARLKRNGMGWKIYQSVDIGKFYVCDPLRAGWRIVNLARARKNCQKSQNSNPSPARGTLTIRHLARSKSLT